MNIKSFFKAVVLTACVFGLVSPALAADKKVLDVKTAWVAGQEGFPIWYAKKQGWDAAKGMNIIMSTYASGNEALQDFAVNNWVLGGLGAIPTVKGAKSGNMLVIGLANDESKANAVMVRPNSPILAKKGVSESYPNVYGQATDVRGKSFIVTELSSSHYTLVKYLEVLGVAEKEVDVKKLDQALGLLSFEHGRADAGVFWAPFTFMASGKGDVTASTAYDVNARLPIYLVANSAYADQYKDVTKNFVALYLRGVDWLINAPREEAVKEMRAYYKEVFNLDYSETMLDLHANIFELFDLKAQKALFAPKDGVSEVQKWQEGITSFMIDHKAVHRSETEKVIGSKYIVPTFIDMIEDKDLQ